jgi:hypothetical protein
MTATLVLVLGLVVLARLLPERRYLRQDDSGVPDLGSRPGSGLGRA